MIGKIEEVKKIERAVQYYLYRNSEEECIIVNNKSETSS